MRCHLSLEAHHQAGRQDIEIIRYREVHPLLEEVTEHLGMQWGAERMSGEDFTKEKMLQLGFEEYIGVYWADLGGRKFQAEGSVRLKSVSEF